MVAPQIYDEINSLTDEEIEQKLALHIWNTTREQVAREILASRRFRKNVEVSTHLVSVTSDLAKSTSSLRAATWALCALAFVGLVFGASQFWLIKQQFAEEILVDLTFVVDNVGGQQKLVYANTGRVPILVQGVSLEIPANPQQQPNLRTAVHKGLSPSESLDDDITLDIHRLFSERLGIPLTANGLLSQPAQGEFAVHIRYFSRGKRRERRVPYRFLWRPPNQGQAEQTEPARDQAVSSVH